MRRLDRHWSDLLITILSSCSRFGLGPACLARVTTRAAQVCCEQKNRRDPSIHRCWCYGTEQIFAVDWPETSRRPGGPSLPPSRWSIAVALQAAGNDAVEADGWTDDPRWIVRPRPEQQKRSLVNVSNCRNLSPELGTRGRLLHRFTSPLIGIIPSMSRRNFTESFRLFISTRIQYSRRRAFGRQKALLEIGEGISGDLPGRRRRAFYIGTNNCPQVVAFWQRNLGYE